MILDEVRPLSPALFFKMSLSVPKAAELDLKKCFKKPYLLPNFPEMTGEKSFAQIAACFSEEGLTFAFKIDQPFEISEYPEYEKGDSVEVCIDTKNIEEARVMHRFCHHFLILGKPIGQTSALEITRFRGEDRHELALPQDILVERAFALDSYSIKVHFPAHILHGFDITESPAIRFTYRIHRAKNKPQHLTLSSIDYQSMTLPMLFTELKLNGN
jgi:hypothetical protein